MIAVGRVIKAAALEATEEERRELGLHVARAVQRALSRTPSTPSMKLITQLVERYEAGALTRVELFQRLEKTS